METTNKEFLWLEFIDRPAFCVKNGHIVAVNSAAQKHQVQSGLEIQQFVAQNIECYQRFQNGHLYMTIQIGDTSYNACVTRTDEYDIFTINQTEEDIHLQALSLAAQQLRIPLSNVMTASDKLFSELEISGDAETEIGQINRSLFRMFRIISNMSDANSYKTTSAEGRQVVNFTSVFKEIIEKVTIAFEHANKKLTYTEPNTAIFGLADEEKLSRAVYNLLSNALKFSPAEGTVDAKLTKTNNHISFSVCNANANPTKEVSFQSQYARKPFIEDSQFGLGLGMTIISSVACAHGGTVLVDHPTQDTTRITMTIALEKADSTNLNSTIVRIGDYAGGRDRSLIEFSETLPPDLYYNIN